MQTLSKTRSAQDNATAQLSLPYVPIAEAAKKRAVDALVPRKAEPEAPDAVGRVASFAIASSSSVSLPETEVSGATVLMQTSRDDVFFRFYVMGLYGISFHEMVSHVGGSTAKRFSRRPTWSCLGIIEMAHHLSSLTFLDAAKSVQCLVHLIRVLEQTSAA